MVYQFAIETRVRHVPVGLHGLQLAAARTLFSRTQSRYFGGLWYKVFSERGPC